MAGVWAAQAEGSFFTLSFGLAFALKLHEKTKKDELCFCENTHCPSLIKHDRGKSQSWKERRADYEV